MIIVYTTITEQIARAKHEADKNNLTISHIKLTQTEIIRLFNEEARAWRHIGYNSAKDLEYIISIRSITVQGVRIRLARGNF